MHGGQMVVTSTFCRSISRRHRALYGRIQSRRSANFALTLTANAPYTVIQSCHSTYFAGTPTAAPSELQIEFNMSVEEAAELAWQAIYHATFINGASDGMHSVS
ncbi:hypothetical protein ACQJBY_062446 [Aegilops geniculata]